MRRMTAVTLTGTLTLPERITELLDVGPMTQWQLARVLGKDEAEVHRALRSMKARGLVIESPDEDGQRWFRLYDR